MKSNTLKQLKPFLEHILGETDYLIDQSANLSYPGFEKSETLKRSFVRALEVIGEAAKNIPDDFRENYLQVAWKEMAGLRDILIHRYFGINYRMVWDVTINKIPDLKSNIQSILREMEEEQHSGQPKKD
jgi:uncharacterized protein with HEPN domain